MPQQKTLEYVMIIHDAMHYINIISLLTYKIGVASRHSIANLQNLDSSAISLSIVD